MERVGVGKRVSGGSGEEGVPRRVWGGEKWLVSGWGEMVGDGW